MTTSTEQVIRLADGRKLGYAEYGDPAGKPLMYFHGLPGSRLEAKLTEPTASRVKARVIGVDRPGYGLSDFKPQRALADWPNDVSELANALGLDRFAILGVSGGGPYALACARKIPARLSAVGVVGGLGPVYQWWAVRDMRWVSRLGFSLARRARWLLQLVYGSMTARIMQWRPEIILSLLTGAAPRADATVLQRPEIRAILLASGREALRNGPKGALWDFVLYAHFWGFNFQDIDITVELWQGEADAVVPPSHGHYQAESLVNGRAMFLPEEGHFSLPVNHMNEILYSLLDR